MLYFQHFHNSIDSAGSGDSGPSMGQDHPSWQFVSIWCLYLNIFAF